MSDWNDVIDSRTFHFGDRVRDASGRLGVVVGHNDLLDGDNDVLVFVVWQDYKPPLAAVWENTRDLEKE